MAPGLPGRVEILESVDAHKQGEAQPFGSLDDVVYSPC